jgi:hypothetical protein
MWNAYTVNAARFRPQGQQGYTGAMTPKPEID